VPITITLPPGGHIGPGFTLQASTSLIGPIPQSWTWQFTVSADAEGLFPYLKWTQPAATDRSTKSTILVWDKGETVTIDPFQHPIQNGAIHINAQLLEGQTAVDSGTTFTSWNVTDAVGDQNYLLPRVDLPLEDHAAILTTEAAVTEELVPQTNPAVRVALGALDLVLGFPTNRLAALECQHYTGRGALQRVSGPIPVDSYGLRWHFVSVPVDFGKRDGAVVEYIERILQLVKVNRDTNGNVYVEEVVDVFWDGGTMSWTWNNLPYEILYDVTPGCTVELCWLLL
jgi:hypothetical protein